MLWLSDNRKRTLSASEGSVPAIAPARAAVSDSTSSVDNVRMAIAERSITRTNENDHEGLLVLDHFHNATEELLNQLSGFGEPAREE